MIPENTEIKRKYWSCKHSHKKKDEKVWIYLSAPATFKCMLRTFQHWSLVLSRRSSPFQTNQLCKKNKIQLLRALLCFYKITGSNCSISGYPTRNKKKEVKKVAIFRIPAKDDKFSTKWFTATMIWLRLSQETRLSTIKWAIKLKNEHHISENHTTDNVLS